MMLLFSFFFFNDTATTEIYTLSLHDALPILREEVDDGRGDQVGVGVGLGEDVVAVALVGLDHGNVFAQPDANSNLDRKSTRLNSSHSQISYAVFCLKKKKKDYRICIEK